MGKNSAIVTGYERTDFGPLLQENLKGTQFTFYPDPYPNPKFIFQVRQCTLCQTWRPAHTISTSKWTPKNIIIP
jgi:hypothetical protein